MPESFITLILQQSRISAMTSSFVGNFGLLYSFQFSITIMRLLIATYSNISKRVGHNSVPREIISQESVIKCYS